MLWDGVGVVMTMPEHVVNSSGAEARQAPEAFHAAPVNGRAGARERLESFISRLPKEEWIRREPAELAQICGCSLRHLRRLFRQCFGVSLRAQQTEHRLHRASQLLMETDDKILSIAYAVGFRHLGLFSRMFKRRFQMTPSEWRAKFRGKTAPADSTTEGARTA
jgi:AraC-like DNA-binding protein